MSNTMKPRLRRTKHNHRHGNTTKHQMNLRLGEGRTLAMSPAAKGHGGQIIERHWMSSPSSPYQVSATGSVPWLVRLKRQRRNKIARMSRKANRP